MRGHADRSCGREALGISREEAYRAPSLALPDPKKAHTRESVAQFEAVQLFIDRALLARPDFRLTAQTLPCSRPSVGPPPPEDARFDARVAVARAAARDDAAFHGASQEGRALTLEQAIKLAK